MWCQLTPRSKEKRDKMTLRSIIANNIGKRLTPIVNRNKLIENAIGKLPKPYKETIESSTYYKRLKIFRNRPETIVSTLLASNPPPHESFKIERAKKATLKNEICQFEGSYFNPKKDRFEFTLQDFKYEGQKYHHSLGDHRISERHLDANVEVGELKKDVTNSRTIYYYDEDPSKLDRMILPTRLDKD